MTFTDEEVAYVRSQPLARLATVATNGQPDVVPVACEFDGTYFWIGGTGSSEIHTRKFRNVLAGNDRVALVIDDMPSFDPFITRSIRVYGRADGPIERVGMVGPGTFLRITPAISWSWNMEGLPAGDAWYEARRGKHDQPTGGRS